MSATETGTVSPSGAIRTGGLLIAGEYAKADHGRHFHTTEALTGEPDRAGRDDLRRGRRPRGGRTSAGSGAEETFGPVVSIIEVDQRHRVRTLRHSLTRSYSARDTVCAAFPGR
ncbi:hypothetical protein OG426_02000 [Streptomyces canus]|uniref:hypothetical protein n=1 Tax=Streptomyces canus TaxID=58343 RepID=UPI003867DF22|nr:hypothetical protein OG426_02000 [Streptomyces canus]